MSRTLFLTGGMPHSSKRKRVYNAITDTKLTSIHIVGETFCETNAVTVMLAELFHLGGRKWNSIKLSNCRGRMDIVLRAIMSASHVRTLILTDDDPFDHGTTLAAAAAVAAAVAAATDSDVETETEAAASPAATLHLVPTPTVASNANTAIYESSNSNSSYLPALSSGLVNHSTLLTLGLHDMQFTKQSIDLLFQGLRSNTSIMELSFNKSIFLDGAHVTLAKHLQNTHHGHNNNANRNNNNNNSMSTTKLTPLSIQYLSFQGCNLSDERVCEILIRLIGHTSLMELSLDGNQCLAKHSMKALARILECNPTLVTLDLSSQQPPSSLQSPPRTPLLQSPPQSPQQTQEQEQQSTSFPSSPSSLGSPSPSTPTKPSATKLLFEDFSKALCKSNLCCLRLSDNVISPDDLSCLAHHGLVNNTSLKILHLAWCDLSSINHSTSMNALSNSLCERNGSLLSQLICYDCGLTDTSLQMLSNHLHKMNHLKRLDLGGHQHFTSYGIESYLLPGISRTIELEEITMAVFDHHSVELLHYYCDINRGGKRYLKYMTTTKTKSATPATTTTSASTTRETNYNPSSLWPLIFNRVLHEMELPRGIVALNNTYKVGEDSTSNNDDDDEHNHNGSDNNIIQAIAAATGTATNDNNENENDGGDHREPPSTRRRLVIDERTEEDGDDRIVVIHNETDNHNENDDDNDHNDVDNSDGTIESRLLRLQSLERGRQQPPPPHSTSSSSSSSSSPSSVVSGEQQREEQHHEEDEEEEQQQEQEERSSPARTTRTTSSTRLKKRVHNVTEGRRASVIYYLLVHGAMMVSPTTSINY